MANPCEDQALEYLRKYNFSVIPVGHDKRPLFSWKAFQERRADANQIKAWWTLYPKAQVGIVTGVISNLSVIDVDSEEGMEALVPFLPNPFQPPMVWTPRGGYHFYCRCDTRVSNKVGVIPGTDLRAEGGYVVAPPSIGINNSQYLWDQDMNLNTRRIPPLPSAYIEKVGARNQPMSHALANGTEDFMTVGRRNNDLFHSLYSMTRLVDTNELRTIAFRLGSSAKPPMDEREIEIVLKSVIERADKKDISLAQDVNDYVSAQIGFFSVNEIIREFDAGGPFGKEDRRNIHTIISRLFQKGVIEKYGEKSGVYRRIDKEKTIIDWQNAETKALELSLPLGLNDYVYTLPKAVITIAGFPSAGKTAFCLNTIKYNMMKFNTLYLCSDLGPEEIKSRLSQHEDVLEDGWNFEAIERSGNFADVMDPNGLNVIDYVRLDEVWRVGAILNSIWEKLKNGVAIVCIQKGWGRVLGRGKEFSLEVPRLYLSMDPGKVRIIKCKNFHHGIDPVGYARYFDLLNGWKFETLGPWKYEPLGGDDFQKPWEKSWEKSRKLF